MTRARTWWLVVIGLAGAVASCAAASSASMSFDDTVQLTGIAAGTALVAIAIGWLALRLLRAKSIGTQFAALALTTPVALGAGAYAAARDMFITQHDLAALLVVLLAAGTVSVASALVFGARIGATSSGLIEAARRIGSELEPPAGEPRRPARGSGSAHELERLGAELAAMEVRLNDAQRRERSLESSRRELVAWVSHDLRTPLAGIRAMVEALEDGVVRDPETVHHYYGTLRQESDRLAALIDDLFELSRAETGTLQLQFERVSLHDIVADALAGCAPVAASKGVRIEERQVGPPAELVVSAPEVLRALRNILENAIRFTPSDGSVVVEAGVDDVYPDGCFVSVRDTGGGIPDDALARVFDVAYQVDPARTPGSGAGLGLAIAKGFIEAHHGELSVRNEHGGAVFTLRLPRVMA
jgi:signal transduction histidine kinase